MVWKLASQGSIENFQVFLNFNCYFLYFKKFKKIIVSKEVKYKAAIKLTWAIDCHNLTVVKSKNVLTPQVAINDTRDLELIQS